MSRERQQATAFVEGYGRTWEDWDFDGFVALFADDVVYVEHPIDETVVGREEMARYIRKEQAEQGTARVRMGKPIVEGNRVVGEFWAAMSNRDGERARHAHGLLRRPPRSRQRPMHAFSPVLVRIRGASRAVRRMGRLIGSARGGAAESASRAAS